MTKLTKTILELLSKGIINGTFTDAEISKIQAHFRLLDYTVLVQSKKKCLILVKNEIDNVDQKLDINMLKSIFDTKYDQKDLKNFLGLGESQPVTNNKYELFIANGWINEEYKPSKKFLAQYGKYLVESGFGKICENCGIVEMKNTKHVDCSN